MRRGVAIAACAAVAHARALGGGFVWLDHTHIEEGAAIASPSSWPSLFTRGFAATGFYRPLMALSLSIDARIGGPFVFHAINVAWHVGAALMTAAAAEALGLSRRAATIAAVLFAVHPLSGLVAGAIAFRSEAIVAVALLGLVWAHVRRKPWAAAATIILAALTKEVGLALAPLFVLAIELTSKRPREGRDRRLLVAEASGFAAALAMRIAYAPPWRASQEPLGFGQALATRLASLWKSALAVLVPFDRTVCDAFPVTELWWPSSIMGFAMAGVVTWLAWRRRGPALLLAFALVPSLQIVPVMRWWSPHYLYVALAFVAMLAAEGIDRLDGWSWKVAGGVSAIFGAITLSDGGRFATDGTLWTPEVAARPACREGHFYLGEIDRQARRWTEAAEHYEEALAPRPRVLAYVDRAAAYQNLGVVRLEQRRFADARAAFTLALAGTSNEQRRRELTHNLAVAEALEQLERARAKGATAGE